ncbi:MAG: hypothetical protein V5A34_09250 [Halapricum sp.]
MYETTYGTEWSTLTDEESIERAFALGVSVALGENQDHPDELDRLKAQTSSAYDQSLVELAYAEGKTKATGIAQEPGSDGSEVWNRLIETEIEIDSLWQDQSPSGGRPDRENETPSSQIDLPSAITRLKLMESHDIDDRDQLRLPRFLR